MNTDGTIVSLAARHRWTAILQPSELCHTCSPGLHEWGNPAWLVVVNHGPKSELPWYNLTAADRRFLWANWIAGRRETVCMTLMRATLKHGATKYRSHWLETSMGEFLVPERSRIVVATRERLEPRQLFVRLTTQARLFAQQAHTEKPLVLDVQVLPAAHLLVNGPQRVRFTGYPVFGLMTVRREDRRHLTDLRRRLIIVPDVTAQLKAAIEQATPHTWTQGQFFGAAGMAEVSLHDLLISLGENPPDQPQVLQLPPTAFVFSAAPPQAPLIEAGFRYLVTPDASGTLPLYAPSASEQRPRPVQRKAR